jgi:hypothetical protein
MDGDLYDEFGNYIGPELSDSEVRFIAAARALFDRPLFALS